MHSMFCLFGSEFFGQWLDSGRTDKKKKVRFSIDEDDQQAEFTGAASGWSGKSGVLGTIAVFVGLFAFFYGSIHNANIGQYRSGK